jgi:hypothetical protein
MAKINLQTPAARAKLVPRGKPYEVRLLPGIHLGYRAAQFCIGTWVAIVANGKGGRWTSAFARADDKQPADGRTVLSYEQAVNRTQALARGDINEDLETYIVNKAKQFLERDIEPGGYLYRHYDPNGDLLYAGATSVLLERQDTHLKTASWRDLICKILIEPFA